MLIYDPYLGRMRGDDATEIEDAEATYIDDFAIDFKSSEQVQVINCNVAAEITLGDGWPSGQSVSIERILVAGASFVGTWTIVDHWLTDPPAEDAVSRIWFDWRDGEMWAAAAQETA